MKTAVDIARELADTLEHHDLEYAIGGALALGYYATPRATVDVDINIFVPPASGLDTVLEVLESAGFEPDDPNTLHQTAVQDGQFRGRVAGIRVDVFVPAIEFYASLAAGKRLVHLFGKPFYILGPEDLLTLKMMSFRRKDIADAEAMLRGEESVDRSTVRARLVEFVGSDDARVREWDQLVAEVDQ